MPRDYYEVLGVTKEATEAEIKRAYRKLARDNHPDRNAGDKQAEARFKEVQEAYDILSDKTKREQYDQFGFAGPQAGPSPGPGGFHWGGGFNQGGGVDPGQMDDILSQLGGANFADLFKQQRRNAGRGPRGGPRQPLVHEIRVPFEVAVLGGAIQVTIDGRTLEVRIPGGIEEGQSLRLQGQGPGNSDLLLKIARIDAHAFFRREGNELLITAPITVAEAVLGTKIDVPTLAGGKLTVKIPPGTSSGGRLRLRGKGINGGDLYVEIKIVAPAKVDDKSRKLMEEFARLNPQQPRTGPPWE